MTSPLSSFNLPVLHIAATKSLTPFRSGFPAWRGPGNPYPVVGWRVRNIDGTFSPWRRAGSERFVGPLILAGPLGYTNFVEGFAGTESGSLEKAVTAPAPPFDPGIFVSAPEVGPTVNASLPVTGSLTATPTMANPTGITPAVIIDNPSTDRTLGDNGPPASTTRRPEDALDVIGWMFVGVVAVVLLALLRRRN